MSSRVIQSLLALAGAIACFGAAACLGAEVRLRDACQSAGGVVRLGDVADVLGNNEKERTQLASLELFPAPPAGRLRYVTSRDVEQLLTLRGFSLNKVQLS